MDRKSQPLTETQSLRTVIEALFRHRWLLSGVTALVLLIAIIAIVVPKRQYSSEMKLLIQNARSTAVLTADKTVMAPSGDVTEQEINSELEVLQSQDVLSKVADPSWKANVGAQNSVAELRKHELKVTKLRKRLSIETARKSNVILVTSLAATPREAAQTLDALWEAYMAKRKELSRPRGATEFFKGEADRYFVEWNRANERLVEFQRANQLVSVPDREDEIRRQIEEVDGQLRVTRTGLEESTKKMENAAVALARTPEREMTAQRTLSNQYSIEQMQTSLLELVNKRTGMLTRYKPTDRLVTELDTQIEQTEAALRNAKLQRGQEDTTDVNPVWQQLKGNQTLEEVNKGALLGRQSGLERVRNNLESDLASTQGLATEYADLKAQADEAQTNFKLFTEKHDQAEIEDDMDQHRLVNVAMAENPTTSYRPYSPRPLQTLAIAILTVFFLGLGLVYVAELSRSTVANARELGAVSAKPILASIPVDERSRGAEVVSGTGLTDFKGSRVARSYNSEPELLRALRQRRTATKNRLWS